MEKAKEFLSSVYALVQFEIQPLLALLAETFSELNVAEDLAENNNHVVDSKPHLTPIQKELDRVKDEQNLKKMNNNLKKDNLGNVSSWDVLYLLKLLKETSFLRITDHKKGKCRLHHTDKCCSNCDHTQKEKCKFCNTPKKHCGIICCKYCNICHRCHQDQLKHTKKPYILNNISLSDLKKSQKVCWVFHLMKSLEFITDCRHLVHYPPKKTEPFFSCITKEIGDFKNQFDGSNHLCREIHFAVAVIYMTILNPLKPCEEMTNKAKEIERKIDNMFIYNNGDCQMVLPSPKEEAAYQKHLSTIVDMVEKCLEEKLAEQFEKLEINKGGMYLVLHR